MSLKLGILSDQPVFVLNLIYSCPYEVLTENQYNADIYICGDDLVRFDRDKGIQDISELKRELKKIKDQKNKPVFILSKTLPKTIDHLSKLFKMRIYSLNIEGKNISFGHNVADKSDVLKTIVNIFDHKQEGKVNIYDYKNRDLEALNYLKIVRECVIKNLNNTFHKYCLKIGVTLFGKEEEDGKPGFGYSSSEIIASYSAELRRMGMQTGVLESTQIENMIYRTMFDDEVPSLEIIVPEKTEEKLKAKCNILKN